MSEKHGYEKVPVSEVREELMSLWEAGMGMGRDEWEEWIGEQTKSVLVKKLLEIKSELSDKEVFDTAESVSDEPLTGVFPNVNAPPARPAFGSIEWSDYCKSLLTRDELDRGAPKCDGVRRLVQDLIGPIITSAIIRDVAPSPDNGGVATVVVGVNVRVKNEEHPAFPCDIYVEDVANCGRYNTLDPYHKHQSATAATRAEGRALRKLLGLKAITAEELQGSDVDDSEFENTWTPETPITEEQINMIDMLCEQLEMSVLDFINSGDKEYTNIYEVPHSTAQKMAQCLNQIRQGKKPRPEVGTYESDWKSKLRT
jgi:hypothetical protein